MMSTLVDSNVIIDILKNVLPWRSWSRLRLAEAADQGNVVVNQIIVAETAISFQEPRAFAALEIAEMARESMPWEAAFLAGQAHRAYRGQGGLRERILPDFLIGAHAEVKSY